MRKRYEQLIGNDVKSSNKVYVESTVWTKKGTKFKFIVKSYRQILIKSSFFWVSVGHSTHYIKCKIVSGRTFSNRWQSTTKHDSKLASDTIACGGKKRWLQIAIFKTVSTIRWAFSETNQSKNLRLTICQVCAAYTIPEEVLWSWFENFYRFQSSAWFSSHRTINGIWVGVF